MLVVSLFGGWCGWCGWCGCGGCCGRCGRGALPTMPTMPTMPTTTKPTTTIPLVSVPPLPVLARLVHLLLDAALLDEVPLQPLDKPDDQGVALMNEHDGDVSDGLVAAFLNLLTIDRGVHVLTAEAGSLNRLVNGPVVAL